GGRSCPGRARPTGRGSPWSTHLRGRAVNVHGRHNASAREPSGQCPCHPPAHPTPPSSNAATEFERPGVRTRSGCSNSTVSGTGDDPGQPLRTQRLPLAGGDVVAHRDTVLAVVEDVQLVRDPVDGERARQRV